jgi:class 3 adenylate cyclase
MTSRAFRETREEVETSIRDTLERESRGFEVRYAYVRVAALAAVLCMNTAAIKWPGLQGLDRVTPINAIVDLLMLGVAVAILFLLRRGWYPPGISALLPAIDATFIFCAYGTILATAEPALFGLGMEDVAVYSALVALSGGLRLWPVSAAFSTIAALTAFVALSMASNEPVTQHSQTLLAIAVAGLFGYRLTTIVRTSLDGEVSRTIFRRFLPEHLVERARQDPLGVIGEPRLVDATILFTDLRNFTGLAETMPPNEVLDYLNEVQGLLAEIVTKHSGTVDTFIGDGMLAVFGAPQAESDHAPRGIAAASEIVSSINALNRGRRERGQPAADIGLGVHTGAVIAGCVGSGSHLQFTVIGDAVNVTSRLEVLTKELGVTALVSEDAVRLASKKPADLTTRLFGGLTPRGQLSLRGRVAPLVVYSLDAVRAAC